ncbi:hypothetical protein EDC01DRAFT_785053 [Geopyxis carbonaria]|nr:hypothetical protein EDC01DRAFT_785053 [Geopyxis carbonaria]
MSTSQPAATTTPTGAGPLPLGTLELNTQLGSPVCDAKSKGRRSVEPFVKTRIYSRNLWSKKKAKKTSRSVPPPPSVRLAVQPDYYTTPPTSAQQLLLGPRPPPLPIDPRYQQPLTSYLKALLTPSPLHTTHLHLHRSSTLFTVHLRITPVPRGLDAYLRALLTMAQEIREGGRAGAAWDPGHSKMYWIVVRFVEAWVAAGEQLQWYSDVVQRVMRVILRVPQKVAFAFVIME